MVTWLQTLAGACALAACLSWLHAARRRWLVVPWHAVAVGVWCALAATGHLAAAAEYRAPELSVVLYLLGACFGAVGVLGIARSVRVSGDLAVPVAEAVLVGTSVVALGWALAGPADLSRTAFALAGITLVSACAAAFVTRLPVVSRRLVINGRIRRTAVGVGVALAFFATSSGLSTLAAMGSHIPAWVPLPLTVAGFVALAGAPWTGQSPAVHLRRQEHSQPYLPVALAILALVAVAIRGGIDGPAQVGRLLAALVIAGVVCVLLLALRENAALVADLQVSRQRLEALVENASDVIVRLDAEGRVGSANGAAGRLLHVDPASLLGREIGALAATKDRERVCAAVLRVTRGWTGSTALEFDLCSPATGTVELRLRGLPGGAVGNLHDVTDAVRLRGRLERMARYDQMTGLANRAHLLDVVGAWLAATPAAAVACLYCDLDDFKSVNDRFGHVAGDGVLVEVARRVAQVLATRPGEEVLAGRIGGDEFVVAVRGEGEAGVNALGHALVAAMRAPVGVGDRKVTLGLSVGIAASWDHPPCAPGDNRAAELLQRADLAMFSAKREGRGRVARWAPALDVAAQRRVDIAIGLRRALETRSLELAYQPLVRLSDGVVTGVEALLRVRDDDREPGALGGLDAVVSPAELVAVAEDTGVIVEIGLWVLSEATRQAAHWLALGHEIQVAVNMSRAELGTQGYGQAVQRCLDRSGLPAGRLVLEITEHQLMSATSPARGALKGLHDLGVGLAIDDFGTGYSSLAYLRDLPVDVVKIDKTLVEGLGSDRKATTLLRAVVGMARALGLLVVAEGVEDLQTARRVRDLGAFAGQGFGICPPIAPAAMTALLDAGPVNLELAGGNAVPAPVPVPAAPATASGVPRRPRPGVSRSETAPAVD